MTRISYAGFNMNAPAKVRLTAKGRARFAELRQQINVALLSFNPRAPGLSLEPALDEEGFHHCALWNLFQDFGPVVWECLPISFEDNTVWIGDGKQTGPRFSWHPPVPPETRFSWQGTTMPGWQRLLCGAVAVGAVTRERPYPGDDGGGPWFGHVGQGYPKPYEGWFDSEAAAKAAVEENARRMLFS